MNISTNTAILPGMTARQMEYVKKTGNVQKKESVEREKICSREEKGQYVICEDAKESALSQKTDETVRTDLYYFMDGMKNFCGGEISLDELQDVMNDYISFIVENTEGISTDMGKNRALDTAYDMLSLWSAQIADEVNTLEGIEVAKKHGYDRSTMNIDFVYYNADYYYKWEEAFRLAGECVDFAAKQLGLKDFERKNDPCNFNHSWGSNYGKIINVEAVPPKGFKFFYRDRIIKNPADRSGNSAIYCTTMIVNGNSVVGGKEIPVLETGKLQNYLERNQYFYPAVNAYDYYMEQGFGGEDGACGFLKNIIIYSKNRMYTRGLESGESDQSYMKISYRSKMFQYMKLLQNH